jgi:2-oxoglutarate dehydrogenase E1 component
MVSCKTFQNGRQMPLRELYQRLRDTYCGSVGVEYMHIDEIEVRRWLQRRLEPIETRIQLSRDEQLRILTRLTDAVMFEEFIRKKFVGAKSFSLEGSETLIPLLDLAIEKAAGQGVAEIVWEWRTAGVSTSWRTCWARVRGRFSGNSPTRIRTSTSGAGT